MMVRFEPGDPGMFQMKLHNGSHELFGLTGKSLETWHHHASSVLKYKTNGQSLKYFCRISDTINTCLWEDMQIYTNKVVQ